MSTEMSIAKRPGLFKRRRVKVMEGLKKCALEDAAEEAAEKDPASKEDSVTEHRDEYQTVEEMINNVEGSDSEGSSEQ